MATLSPEEMGLLASLARSPFGQRYRQILEKKLRGVDESLRRLDAPEVYRAQGAAQAIEQLLAEFDEAVRKEEARVRSAMSFKPMPHAGLV